MSNRQQATEDGEYSNAGQNFGEQTEEKKFVWKTVIHNVDSGKKITARFCRYVIEGIESPWPEESWKTFVLWILSIIIDPLVLYVPRINDKKRLLDFDTLFLLLLSVLYFVVHICMLMIYCKTCKKSYPKLWWVFIVGAPLVPVLTNGPLQLLLIFKSTKKIRASLFSCGMGLFLILYLVRVMGIYRLFVATALRESAFLRILINFMLYLYGGHVFGGLWYFFAVWKKMQCWSTACRNHGKCYYANHRFNVISGDNRFLDDICFKTIEDTTYELGIFKEALESRIVETKDLAKKLLYCLRWGTQNLSGYGQNLEVSTYSWENIFVILLAIYGMATFAFFIGSMQNLIKFSSKSGETRWREQVLKKWSPFEKLPVELQNCVIKECAKFNYQQMGDVDVKILLSNLPKDVQNNIKYELCSKLLEKVEYFQRWNETQLVNLYDCIKPVVHTERSRIVCEGDPIVEMWFVVQGEVWTYSSKVVTTDSTNCLEFWGEELFDWAQNESNIPISNRTIHTLTKVEAFVLTAHDFQKLYNTH